MKNVISAFTQQSIIALAAKLGVVPSITGEEILSEIAVDKVVAFSAVEVVIARITQEGVVSSITGEQIIPKVAVKNVIA